MEALKQPTALYLSKSQVLIFVDAKELGEMSYEIFTSQILYILTDTIQCLEGLHDNRIETDSLFVEGQQLHYNPSVRIIVLLHPCCMYNLYALVKKLAI